MDLPSRLQVSHTTNTYAIIVENENYKAFNEQISMSKNCAAKYSIRHYLEHSLER